MIFYSFVLNTDELIPGFFILSASLLLIAVMIKKNFSASNPSESGFASGILQEEKSAVKRLPLFIKYFLIPALSGILIIVRIYCLADHSREVLNTNVTASVEEVKTLRYNKEITLNLIEAGTGADLGRAITYSGTGIDFTQGDILQIHSLPAEINVNESRISDFNKSLLRKGYHYFVNLNDNRCILIKKSPPGVRKKIREGIEKKISGLFNEKTSPVVSALYFGNQNIIEKETINDFKRSGALHILAASGLHIGIIVSMIFFILSPFKIGKKYILLITSAVLFFYLYITDMPVSLVRAYVMFLIYSIQYFFDMDKNIFNTLFLSTIIILFIHPYELYSLGFQLSFGATLGIILFYRFYRKSFTYLSPWIAGSMSVTISAQTAVFPIILANMKEINLSGIISNLILIPGMTATLIISITACITDLLWSYAGSLLGKATDYLFTFNYYIVQKFSLINGHFKVSDINYSILFPYILLFIPLIPFAKIRKIQVISIPLAVFTAWMFLSHLYTLHDKSIAVMKNEKSSVTIIKKGDTGYMYGIIGESGDSKILANYISSENIRDLRIYIPGADFNNLKEYLFIIKRTIVSECTISSDFIFSSFFIKFCHVLDDDGIKLKITEFRTEAENKNKINMVNNFTSLLNNPVNNMDVLHNYISSNYGIIDDMAGDEYPVSYLE